MAPYRRRGRILRVFVAVEIAEDVRKKISSLIRDLNKIDSETKWVIPENLHITLKFLGYLTQDELGQVIETVKKAHQGTKPFEIEYTGLGWFPERQTPRVFWIGIKGEIEKLALQIENALAKKGIEREKRPFAGHLTLGRVKGKKGIKELKEKVAQLKDWSAGKMLVDRVIVYKSTLTRQGPIYEKIMEELL